MSTEADGTAEREAYLRGALTVVAAMRRAITIAWETDSPVLREVVLLLDGIEAGINGEWPKKGGADAN
jgi:hypothetical protein